MAPRVCNPGASCSVPAKSLTCCSRARVRRLPGVRFCRVAGAIGRPRSWCAISTWTETRISYSRAWPRCRVSCSRSRFSSPVWGVAQNGRPLTIRARAPNPGQCSDLRQRASHAPAVFDVGVLRLDPGFGLITLASVPISVTGVVELTLPTQVTFPEFELPMQMGYLDLVRSEIFLSNLEWQGFVGH